MWKLLIKINKNLIVAIPLFLITGFLFGITIDKAIIAKMKLLILPLTFLMVYPMMVSLNLQHLKKGLNLKLQGTTQFINFCLIPFVAFYLGKIFFADQPYMALGLLLASLLPTSGMTISQTAICPPFPANLNNRCAWHCLRRDGSQSARNYGDANDSC
jgi:ACR3 family arsenite transporter